MPCVTTVPVQTLCSHVEAEAARPSRGSPQARGPGSGPGRRKKVSCACAVSCTRAHRHGCWWCRGRHPRLWRGTLRQRPEGWRRRLLGAPPSSGLGGWCGAWLASPPGRRPLWRPCSRSRQHTGQHQRPPRGADLPQGTDPPRGAGEAEPRVQWGRGGTWWHTRARREGGTSIPALSHQGPENTRIRKRAGCASVSPHLLGGGGPHMPTGMGGSEGV